MPKGAELPWEITLHFGNIPMEHVLPCFSSSSPSLPRLRFFHSLKQAFHVLSGNYDALSELPSSSEDELWKSVGSSHFGTFHNITKDLRIPTAEAEWAHWQAQQSPRTRQTGIRAIPLRILQTGAPPIQRKVPVFLLKEEEEEGKGGEEEKESSVWTSPSSSSSPPPFTTLQDVLLASLPTGLLDRASFSAGEDGGGLLACLQDPYDLLVQGLSLRAHPGLLTEPLVFLWPAFRHSDLFMYVAVGMRGGEG